MVEVQPVVAAPLPSAGAEVAVIRAGRLQAEERAVAEKSPSRISPPHSKGSNPQVIVEARVVKCSKAPHIFDRGSAHD